MFPKNAGNSIMEPMLKDKDCLVFQKQKGLSQKAKTFGQPLYIGNERKNDLNDQYFVSFMVIFGSSILVLESIKPL